MPQSVGENVVTPGGINLLELLFGADFDAAGTGANNESIIRALLGGANGGGADGQGGLLGSSNFPYIMEQGRNGFLTSGGPEGFSPFVNTHASQGGPLAIDPGNTRLLGALPSSHVAGYWGTGDQQGVASRWADSNDSWGRRYDTPTYDAQGNAVLPSMLELSGRRAAADYGGRQPISASNPYGFNPHTGSSYDLFNTFSDMQANQSQNPWLDPVKQITSFRDMESTSRFGAPDPGAYVEGQARNFATGPQVNPFAADLIQGTQGLTNQYESSLLGAIDTGAQQTLSNRLQDTQSTLAAMGLGRSGAGMLQAQQNQNDILGQANRDKQSVMANFREGALGREAQALSQAQGMRGDEAMAEQQRRSGMLSQGLGDLANINLSGRQAERDLFGQAAGQQAGLYEGDMGRLLQGLTASDDASFRRLMGEDQMRSQGMRDYAGLFSERDSMYDNRLGSMLDMSDRMRAIENERLAQQQYYGMLPFNTLLQLVTGTSPSTAPVGATSPWGSVGPQIVGAAGANLLGGALGGSYSGSGNPLAGLFE